MDKVPPHVQSESVLFRPARIKALIPLFWRYADDIAIGCPSEKVLTERSAPHSFIMGLAPIAAGDNYRFIKVCPFVNQVSQQLEINTVSPAPAFARELGPAEMSA